MIGLGTMGAGIAQVFAESGMTVVAVETSPETLARGLESINALLSGAIARGRQTEAGKEAVLGRIQGVIDVAALHGVDAVLEALPEDIAIKRAVLSEVAQVVGPQTPILTNTSVLSVARIASLIPNPARVAGLHFFNPAPVVRTVEIVSSIDTDPALVERLVDLVESLDKVAVQVKDRPGFLINALLFPYLNDVIQELDDGLATAEDIDVALKLGLGYRTGPLEMLDLIGLDTHLQATEAIYQATGDARYAPPPLLRQMVTSGRLGDKTGSGFRTAGELSTEGS
ncbi:3-hydroxyacyl-CoA dehydrogenase family protein [Streptosporangium sp. NPDC051023]|uniref:3-hydroxyacyl-CoA dehydrogenase family protein n=1 Tax=Streptosporangium sp. NPDC051023 TaxID=3155410 RepID=UPI00344EAD64